MQCSQRKRPYFIFRTILTLIQIPKVCENLKPKMNRNKCKTDKIGRNGIIIRYLYKQKKQKYKGSSSPISVPTWNFRTFNPLQVSQTTNKKKDDINFFNFNISITFFVFWRNKDIQKIFKKKMKMKIMNFE